MLQKPGVPKCHLLKGGLVERIELVVGRVPNARTMDFEGRDFIWGFFFGGFWQTKAKRTQIKHRSYDRISYKTPISVAPLDPIL